MNTPFRSKTKGYGAQPHGERREGYPNDQANPEGIHTPVMVTGAGLPVGSVAEVPEGRSGVARVPEKRYYSLHALLMCRLNGKWVAHQGPRRNPARNERHKKRSPEVLVTLTGPLASFNYDLKERMSELYTRMGYSCDTARNA